MKNVQQTVQVVREEEMSAWKLRIRAPQQEVFNQAFGQPAPDTGAIHAGYLHC